MRAPARSELLVEFAEFLAEQLPEESRYADADLAPPADAGDEKIAPTDEYCDVMMVPGGTGAPPGNVSKSMTTLADATEAAMPAEITIKAIARFMSLSLCV